MNITRVGSLGSKRGRDDWFTGTVWLEPVTAPRPDLDVHVVLVTFESGARTVWHTHPHGQLLRIVSGVGRVQKWGDPIVEVHPGDSVWFAPGEKHWHGAAVDSVMVHLAVQKADAAGETAVWLERVGDSPDAPSASY